MSASQLHRILGTTYETAWFLFHRLREALTDHNPGPLGGENKVVEADETYMGGKAKNKAYGPPPKKATVFTLVERDGKARSFHVVNVNSKTLRPIIVTTANRKTYLMTDESPVYPKVGKELAGHGTFNHDAEEYVRGKFWCTNTVESNFALFKRGVYGSFHSVSEAHLLTYLAEFDFQHNHSKVSDAERAEELLRGAKGKRLMYHQPREAANA